MRTIGKVLFVLAIISLFIIFALKMENNMEMKQYFTEKEIAAQNKLDELNRNSN